MADEEIPENIDLRFLATQNARILHELKEARAARSEMNHRFDSLDAAVKAIGEQGISAARTTEKTAEIVEAIGEHLAKGQQLTGSRLNAIEQRLARIEEHTGLVKA
jgi:hypothetical protein